MIVEKENVYRYEGVWYYSDRPGDPPVIPELARHLPDDAELAEITVYAEVSLLPEYDGTWIEATVVDIAIAAEGTKRVWIKDQDTFRAVQEHEESRLIDLAASW